MSIIVICEVDLPTQNFPLHLIEQNPRVGSLSKKNMSGPVTERGGTPNIITMSTIKKKNYV